jgi:hypothetical protein
MFQECEQKYLAQVDKWKACLEEIDTNGVQNLLGGLVKVADKFSAPFVQAYGILDLI